MPVPDRIAGVDRRSLREIAGDRIRAAIFDGTLRPGERLIDQDLQEWLGISRTPLREALNDLTRVGLVETVAQRFTRVAAPRPEDRVAILQTLGALIGGIVRLTVPQLRERDLSEIQAMLTALLEVVEAEDPLTHGDLGWRFVDRLIELCPNAYLVRATRDTVNALAYQLAITRTDSSTSWSRARDGYSGLAAALHDGDPIAAELAIEVVFWL